MALVVKSKSCSGSEDLFVFERLERRSYAKLEVRGKVGQFDAAVNRREQTLTNIQWSANTVTH